MWWVSHVRTRFVTLYGFTRYQRKIFSDILWELSQVFMSACHKHLYGRYISILLLCSICYTILSSWLPWQSQQSTADWPHSFSHRSTVLGQVWYCGCVKVGHNWKTCSGVWMLVPHGHSSVHSWRRQVSFTSSKKSDCTYIFRHCIWNCEPGCCFSWSDDFCPDMVLKCVIENNVVVVFLRWPDTLDDRNK